MLGGILSLQLGAFCVVLQTLASGISELPFGSFVLLMQPIHLAIGIVEGAVTAALVSFVWKARPEVIDLADGVRSGSMPSLKPVLVALGIAAVFTGGVLSWFASAHPDGLEWSMFRASGSEELEAPADGIHTSLAGIQERVAVLPDYGFAEPENAETVPAEEAEAWPAVNAGTSVSGIVGGTLVLLIAGLIGVSLRFLQRSRQPATP
jgi:cobalt/nickel transport system permease protein